MVNITKHDKTNTSKLFQQECLRFKKVAILILQKTREIHMHWKIYKYNKNNKKKDT